MSRKGMDVSEWKDFLGRCKNDYRVRYVEPVIHPRAGQVVKITLYMDDGSIPEFEVKNHPNENYDLVAEVHSYLDMNEAIGDIQEMYKW